LVVKSLGGLLFRFRAAIGVAGFLLTYYFAHPLWPGSGLQQARWPLLSLIPVSVGMALRLWAAGYIGRAGRDRQVNAAARASAAAGRRSVAQPQLVTSGPYRYVRHPLYVGNFLLVLGSLVALSPPVWLSVAVLAFFVIEYRLIAQAEERKLAGAFGEDYVSYRNRTPSVFPRFHRADASRTEHFRWSRAFSEWNTLLLLVLLYAAAHVRTRLRF
jgi:protein-S-isoprenylcysteine O-methyltransferase Ste14